MGLSTICLKPPAHWSWCARQVLWHPRDGSLNRNEMSQRTEVSEMVLAIAALLLHAPAVPQSSLSKISSVASITEGATPEPGREPISGGSSAEQPAIVAALQPGRLTPTPVEPASPDAASAPALFPSSPAAAAAITFTPTEVRTREQEERRKRLWLGLSIAQSSAATFDAWTTRRAISSGGEELNPMLRPFAGNASLYAAIQVAPLLLDYLGRHMMNSQRGWERHTWWVPQGVGTAMSVFSGVHNLGVQ